MSKLVVLKLDGDLEHHGFRVTLEIGQEDARSDLELQGNLPASPDLLHSLKQWRNSYSSLAGNNRIKPKEIIYSGSINRQINECNKSANQLSKFLQNWLNSSEFQGINHTLREELNREEVIRVLICSENSQVLQLPWHLWDFFHKFTKAEFAFSTIAFQKIGHPQPKAKVKILAILGSSYGIDVNKDRELLENLPDAETLFLVEPRRNELNNKLWEQPWQILFFAGHSETNDDAGIIHLNQHESLTIEELKYALKSAIAQGLQLAIFNSCDGLGLARQLAALHIPQMIVMREPVPDQVAQDFLKHFLKAFTTGNSLYLALRQAREQLQGLEDNYPNATWLPVIFQNQGIIPPTWQDLVGAVVSRGYPLTKQRQWNLLGIVALLSIVSIIYGKNLKLKKLASENGELKKHESEFQVLLDKEHKLQRLIKDLKLKKISKDEINNLCRNPCYYMQKIRDDYPEYKGKKESDFTLKEVFPKSELKGKVIPAFTVRCSFKVKSGDNSREGSEATIDIGLSMDKYICRSTEKNPIIAIPFDPLDPFNHYCVNTTDR